jgi:hypothetical protein
MTCGQIPFVTVLWMVTVTFVPQQPSVALGVVKDQRVPHNTLRFEPQTRGRI